MSTKDTQLLAKLVLEIMYAQADRRVILGVEEIAAELAKRGHTLTPTQVMTVWKRAIGRALDGELAVPRPLRRPGKLKARCPDDKALDELILWLYCRKGTVETTRCVQDELKRLGIKMNWQAIWGRLQRAVEQKRVEIRYLGSTEKWECAALTHRLISSAVKHAVVVPGLPEILDATGEERRLLRRQVVARAARDVVSELERIICELATRTKNRPGLECVRIGVSWGGTLARVARQLLRTPRPRGFPARIELVPVVGSTDIWTHRPTEGFANASAFARGLRTPVTTVAAAYLPAPAFVTAREYAIAIQLATVKSMLDEIRRCHIILTSLGPVLSAESVEDIVLSADTELNAAMREEFMRGGRVVAVICGIPIDAKGEFVPTGYRSIGIDLQTIRTMVNEYPKRHVVVVACGDRTRIEPLRAVLAGRLATSVITDSVMANALYLSE